MQNYKPMPLIQKCLAFDYGTSSIGVAVGQSLTCSANPLPALAAKRGALVDREQLNKLVKLWQPAFFIVGWPHTNGHPHNFLASLAKQFAKQLEQSYQLECHMLDESYTTTSAKSALYEQYGKRGLQKAKIDSWAAKIICEDWLNSHFMLGD